jgi:hypothetical protein
MGCSEHGNFLISWNKGPLELIRNYHVFVIIAGVYLVGVSKRMLRRLVEVCCARRKLS